MGRDGVSEGWLTAAKLAAVVALVLANGFFVASEFALVAVRRSRVDELVAKGVLGAKAVQRAVANLDHFIAATQLGITLASLALGWIGEPTLGHLLERAFGHSPSGALLSFIIAFTIITALHIVVGELAPKSIALQYPERTSLAIAQPLGVFDLVFRPFIVTLNGIGRFTVRLLGLRPAGGHELIHSADELRMLVEASGKAGALEESEQRIIERAFDFADFSAHEAMTPRTEVVMAPADVDGRRLLDLTHAAGFTRYPVYGTSQDDIVGILHVKDLLDAVREGRLETVTARELAREAVVVPETLGADAVLDRMRAANRHMAIVIDEFGGVAGIVTMEDILERLVGALRDEFEHRDVEPDVETLPDGSVVVSGLMLIEDANARFGLTLETDEYDTLGGFVFGALGRVAQVGDGVEAGGTRLEVRAMDGLRVDRVQLLPQSTSRSLERSA
jgi:CBS domain containing-hemolysin-like protein